jgi:CheY-like chemotaxis protein
MAKLLLVDDEEGSLAWMRAALGSAGHEVRTSAGPRAALDELRTYRPDLIISDILMPEIDGLAFARLVQRYLGVPLMFISITKKAGEAVLAGAVGYVQKPVTASEVRSAVERVLGKGATRNTLLVVDDDPDVRWLYRSFLEPRFKVLEAGDGREALALLRREPVSLAIVDVHMPVMNGVELVRAMRDDPALREVPVIVQTSDPSALAARVWIDLQVSGTVEKGRFLEWLSAKIDAHTSPGSTPSSPASPS